jgi:hypothetical protein
VITSFKNFKIYFFTFTERSVKVVGNRRELRVIFNRLEPMLNISHLILGHNCQTGPLFVYSFEIKGLDTNNSYIASINEEVEYLQPNRNPNKQRYKCEIGGSIQTEEDLKPIGLINLSEMSIFLYLSCNSIILLSAILNLCPITQCNDSNKTVISVVMPGIFSSLLSILIFLLVNIVYRYCVKMRYSQSFGSNFWYRIILFYLIMSFLLGFVFGISGSLYAILLDINIESYNKALMIGFILLIVSILIIIFSSTGFWTVSQKKN